jgi:hypothetical protein
MLLRGALMAIIARSAWAGDAPVTNTVRLYAVPRPVLLYAGG